MRISGIWVGTIVLLVTCAATAQEIQPYKALISRLAASGYSNTSSPAGYKAYSSVNMAWGIRCNIRGPWSAELSLGFESREIDYTGADGKEISLGSVELLPTSLLILYQHNLGNWRPYAGAGLHYTSFWEGSGELNSSNVRNASGLVLQLGLDYYISEHLFFNVDIKSMVMKTSFDWAQQESVELDISPTVFGIGLGFAI